MKAYAIHTIHRKPDPRGEVEVIPAGAVFDATKDDFDPKAKGSLARDGAIRPATKVDEARYAERLAAEAEQDEVQIDPLAVQSEPTDGGETGTGGGKGGARGGKGGSDAPPAE